jgi:hypothetical protein
MSTSESNPWSDAGVSEAIGFLLIFTIIITGIALVTLYGYPVLLQQQSNANEQVMEKNMIVLQNDLKSLSYSMVPYSETSLSIGGGTLFVYNASYSSTPAMFNVECNNNPLIIPYSTGKIEYESVDAQTNIALENGAVVTRMTTVSGSTMLAEPRWFYDGPTNTAALYLISFNTTSTLSRAGVGTVSMERGISNYSAIQIQQGETCTVSYTPDPTSDYSVAWNNYFANDMGLTELSPGKYLLLTGPGQIVVYQDNIEVVSV